MSQPPEHVVEEKAPVGRWRRVRAGLRSILAAWWPRVVVLMVVVLAFVAGLWFGPPRGCSDAGASHEQEGHEGSKDTVWTCSMHPQVKLPEPGQCPICGMDLIPLTKDDEADGEDRSITVSLSERAKKLAEVRTVRVGRAETGVELKLLGRLEYDETRERTVAPWTGGRIERLFVSSEGAKVGRGQVIAHLFSPEVYSAHQDLIQARLQRALLGSGLEVAQFASKAAVEAARNRLVLLGVSSEDIDQMEKADEPWRYVKIRSSFGGTVLDLHVAQGAYVAAGTPMFRVADLSRLWMQLDAYESDLTSIALKQAVTLRVNSFPGERFQGKVSFIDPVVDPRLRTVQVRVEVANKDGRLRPGMFAEAVLDAKDTKADALPLVIPATAPLFTGTRSVVYVEVPYKDRPTYEAREVRLGPRAGEFYPVVLGLEENERVVIRGAFRLDSDLQLRGGRSMMARQDDRARAAAAPIDVPEAFHRGLKPVLESYLALHVALSKDDLQGAREAWGGLAKAVSSFRPRGPEAARELWSELGADIAKDALLSSKAKGMKDARRHLESVSTRVIQVLQRLGNPLADPIRLAYCPMAAGSKGAFWLQKAESIENPYFGASMFSCGEVRESVPSGKHLESGATRSHGSEAAAPAAHKH